MADLQRILGTMLSTGLGGNRRRPPNLDPATMSGGTGGGGSGFMRGAGLAALGYLAYRAYQERQANQAGQARQTPSGSAAPAEPRQPSFLDKLGGLFNPSASTGTQTPSPTAGAAGGAAAPAIDDRKALLLIRAMIAAAYADGQIDPQERQRILGKLHEEGISREDRDLVERELTSPMPIDTLLREVDGLETAEQVYAASQMAIDVDTEAERSYLNYLAARLNLDPQRVAALNRIGA